MTHPDPLAALDEIAARAKEAQRKLSAGLAINGTGALRDIELVARDVADDCRAGATTEVEA